MAAATAGTQSPEGDTATSVDAQTPVKSPEDEVEDEDEDEEEEEECQVEL